MKYLFEVFFLARDASKHLEIYRFQQFDFKFSKNIYDIFTLNPLNINSPSQWRPSPTYPGKQVQVKLPKVLVQCAKTSHGLYLHSFSSERQKCQNSRQKTMCEKLRRFSPGTWQLHPPKPSLQWHRWSKHTPFVHCDPSSLSQSSGNKAIVKYLHPPLRKFHKELTWTFELFSQFVWAHVAILQAIA